MGSILTGFCLSGIRFKISKWVPLAYGLGTFQSAIFVLVFRSSEFVHEPFKSRFFTSYSSIVFLDIFPVGFLREVYGSSFLLCRK